MPRPKPSLFVSHSNRHLIPMLELVRLALDEVVYAELQHLHPRPLHLLKHLLKQMDLRIPSNHLSFILKFRMLRFQRNHLSQKNKFSCAVSLLNRTQLRSK